MQKAEVEVPREAKLTAVTKIPAIKYQSTEVEAEYAEEHEDTPEDEAVDGSGVQVVQGEAVAPTHDEDVPRTPLDRFCVHDHPPDGGGVQVVQCDRGLDPQDETPDDGDGFHVQERPPDGGGV